MSRDSFDLATLVAGEAVYITTHSGTTYTMSIPVPPYHDSMVTDTHLNGVTVKRGEKHAWDPGLMVQRHIVIGKPFQFGLIRTSSVVSIKIESELTGLTYGDKE